MRLEQSPFLREQLEWEDCCPEDGLSWKLMQGGTRFNMFPRAENKRPTFISLSEQMASAQAAPPSPQLPSPKPSQSKVMAQKSAVSAAITESSATSSGAAASSQAAEAIQKIAQGPKKHVLWCSWGATHGHVVYLQAASRNLHQVRHCAVPVTHTPYALGAVDQAEHKWC